MSEANPSAPSKPVIGIIGGSGVYEIEGLTNTRWERIESSFGEPSDELFFGELDGQQLVFLPRHGRGHRIPPNAVNYRANIDALKRAGCTEIIAVNAVGSLHEDLPPGTFVLVDQFIDRTIDRVKSFFGTGLVGHVGFGHPICSRLTDALYESGEELGYDIVKGGTLVVMEGPQFSTLAESNMHRSWGCTLVGMTNMPEAKLAREAEMCYACIAMVTDFDCWHPDHASVTVDAVIGVLMANADKGRALVKSTAPKLSDHQGPCKCGCQTSLDVAIMTAPDVRDPAMIEKLRAVAGRVLKS